MYRVENIDLAQKLEMVSPYSSTNTASGNYSFIGSGQYISGVPIGQYGYISSGDIGSLPVQQSTKPKPAMIESVMDDWAKMGETSLKEIARVEYVALMQELVVESAQPITQQDILDRIYNGLDELVKKHPDLNTTSLTHTPGDTVKIIRNASPNPNPSMGTIFGRH